MISNANLLFSIKLPKKKCIDNVMTRERPNVHNK